MPPVSTDVETTGAEPPRKRRRTSAGGSSQALLLSGLAGGIAGCVAKTSVAPLDRVKILFQAGEPHYARFAGSFTGVFHACGKILRDEGPIGLLRGHSATLFRIFPYAAIKYMAYEKMHSIFMPTPDKETAGRLFLAGSTSGVISVFVTYPLELLRVRLAYETHAADSRVSLIHTMKVIYREGTPTGGEVTRPRGTFDRFPVLKFYRGFAVSVMGMIPYAGVSFVVYGSARRWMADAIPGAKDHKTGVDLASGALAGACSQTASYPFEVIRRRMQVGGLLRPDRSIGFSETVTAIYQRSGWRGFFIGLSIGYLKIVPMTALSFTTWQACKRAFGLEVDGR